MSNNDETRERGGMTPGPWRWDATPWNYDVEEDAPWLVVDDNECGPSKRVLWGEIHCSEANAKAIAELPTLVAQLKACVEVMTAASGQMPTAPKWSDLIATSLLHQARAATDVLKKAGLL